MAKYHANIWKNIYSKHHIRYAQWFFCCYCEIFIAYRTICPGFSWILSKYLWNMRSPWTGNDFSYFSSLSLFIETIPPVTRLHGLLGFAFCSIFLWNKMKIYIKTLFLNYLILVQEKISLDIIAAISSTFSGWIFFQLILTNNASRIINDYIEQLVAVPKRCLQHGLF